MSSDNRDATILVVDDLPANIDFLVAVLSGYDVIPALSGEEALNILAKESVDLVLLDILMPEMNGFEVCQRIKDDFGLCDLPVIFITAKDDIESIERAYRVGGYDYISKPIRAAEVLARVNTQLQLHHQYKTLKEQNQSLTEARAALSESEERYRLAMQAVNDGLWDWDLSREKVYYSPSWLAIVGEQQLDPNLDTWQVRLHPADQAVVLQSLQRHLDGLTADWSQEFRLRHANGSWLWVIGRGRVVQRDADGRALRMVGTMVDVSERHQHQRLLELRQRLAERVSGEPRQLMRIALEAAEELTHSELGFFHEVDADQQMVLQQVWSNQTLQRLEIEPQTACWAIAECPDWADAIREQRPIFIDHDNEFSQQGALPEGHPVVRRELIVPLLRDGQVRSVIGVANKPAVYTEADAQLLILIADMCQDMLERRLTEQRMAFMAFNDPLTGLPNRALLMDRLQHGMAASQRTDKVLALCYFDLDGFKPVNDRYGHQMGDRLLIDLAQRLNECIREGDTASRMGGDEFVLLLVDLDDAMQGEAIVDRLLQTIAQPFVIRGETLHVTASAGLTFYPIDNVDAKALVRHADEAMYLSKQQGKSCYSIYPPLVKQLKRRREHILQELQDALRKGFLELYYYPRIDLATGQVVSVEALLRWNHPVRGLLAPEYFLPLVSGTALEHEIYTWLIEQTLGQHHAWAAQGLVMPVSVTVPPRYRDTHPFALDFDNALNELSDASPESLPEGLSGALELEVLAPDSVQHLAAASASMLSAATQNTPPPQHQTINTNELPGSGALPVDMLKIDRMFVIDMLDHERHLEAVERIAWLGASLQRPVVADGVESIEVAILLLAIGCQYAQGFAIAHPMPAIQLPDWLASWGLREDWQDLQALIDSVDAPNELKPALLGHRRWQQRLARYLDSQANVELPSLDERKCQLGRWLRGMGEAYFGASPDYPKLLQEHARLHHLVGRFLDEKAKQQVDNRAEIAAQLEHCAAQVDRLLLGLPGSLSDNTGNHQRLSKTTQQRDQ